MNSRIKDVIYTEYKAPKIFEIYRNSTKYPKYVIHSKKRNKKANAKAIANVDIFSLTACIAANIVNDRKMSVSILMLTNPSKKGRNANVMTIETNRAEN